jgi:LAO/AO transport system kinase
VLQLSALKATGIDAFWSCVSRFREAQSASGQLQARRKSQSLAWMWERIESGLRQEFREHPAVRQLLPTLIADVQAARLPASTAARQLLQARRT